MLITAMAGAIINIIIIIFIMILVLTHTLQSTRSLLINSLCFSRNRIKLKITYLHLIGEY